MTHAFLLDFLRRLEADVPPPPDCHHAITFARYGSDEAGWEDKLALQVNRDGVFHCFFLEESDCLQAPADIAASICTLLAEPTPPNAQLGVGMGQYHSSAQGLNRI